MCPFGIGKEKILYYSCPSNQAFQETDFLFLYMKGIGER